MTFEARSILVDFIKYYVGIPLISGLIYLVGFGGLTLISHLIEGPRAPF